MESAPPAVQRVKPPLALVKFANPVMRRLLSSPAHPLGSRHLLLLELTGRRTNRVYRVPVGYHDIEGQLGVFTNSGWRVNVRGGADVTVTFRGVRRAAHADLDEDPARIAAVYATVIEQLGWQPAQRRLGIKINVGRTPTVDELAAAVRASGLSIVRLELG